MARGCPSSLFYSLDSSEDNVEWYKSLRENARDARPVFVVPGTLRSAKSKCGSSLTLTQATVQDASHVSKLRIFTEENGLCDQEKKSEFRKMALQTIRRNQKLELLKKMRIISEERQRNVLLQERRNLIGDICNKFLRQPIRELKNKAKSKWELVHMSRKVEPITEPPFESQSCVESNSLEAKYQTRKETAFNETLPTFETLNELSNPKREPSGRDCVSATPVIKADNSVVPQHSWLDSVIVKRRKQWLRPSHQSTALLSFPTGNFLEKIAEEDMSSTSSISADSLDGFLGNEDNPSEGEGKHYSPRTLSLHLPESVRVKIENREKLLKEKIERRKTRFEGKKALSCKLPKKYNKVISSCVMDEDKEDFLYDESETNCLYDEVFGRKKRMGNDAELSEWNTKVLLESVGAISTESLGDKQAPLVCELIIAQQNKASGIFPLDEIQNSLNPRKAFFGGNENAEIMSLGQTTSSSIMFDGKQSNFLLTEDDVYSAENEGARELVDSSKGISQEQIENFLAVGQQSLFVCNNLETEAGKSKTTMTAEVNNAFIDSGPANTMEESLTNQDKDKHGSTVSQSQTSDLDHLVEKSDLITGKKSLNEEELEGDSGDTPEKILNKPLPQEEEANLVLTEHKEDIIKDNSFAYPAQGFERKGFSESRGPVDVNANAEISLRIGENRGIVFIETKTDQGLDSSLQNDVWLSDQPVSSHVLENPCDLPNSPAVSAATEESCSNDDHYRGASSLETTKPALSFRESSDSSSTISSSSLETSCLGTSLSSTANSQTTGQVRRDHFDVSGTSDNQFNLPNSSEPFEELGFIKSGGIGTKGTFCILEDIERLPEQTLNLIKAVAHDSEIESFLIPPWEKGDLRDISSKPDLPHSSSHEEEIGGDEDLNFKSRKNESNRLKQQTRRESHTLRDSLTFGESRRYANEVQLASGDPAPGSPTWKNETSFTPLNLFPFKKLNSQSGRGNRPFSCSKVASRESNKYPGMENLSLDKRPSSSPDIQRPLFRDDGVFNLVFLAKEGVASLEEGREKVTDGDRAFRSESSSGFQSTTDLFEGMENDLGDIRALAFSLDNILQTSRPSLESSLLIKLSEFLQSFFSRSSSTKPPSLASTVDASPLSSSDEALTMIPLERRSNPSEILQLIGQDATGKRGNWKRLVKRGQHQRNKVCTSAEEKVGSVYKTSPVSSHVTSSLNEEKSGDLSRSCREDFSSSSVSYDSERSRKQNETRGRTTKVGSLLNPNCLRNGKIHPSKTRMNFDPGNSRKLRYSQDRGEQFSDLIDNNSKTARRSSSISTRKELNSEDCIHRLVLKALVPNVTQSLEELESARRILRERSWKSKRKI